MFQQFTESDSGSNIVDLSKPSLAGLAYLLRHMPADFTFNFFSCSTCAMGLAHTMWPQEISCPTSDKMAAGLMISHDDTLKLFVARGGKGFEPEDIAAEIEEMIK